MVTYALLIKKGEFLNSCPYTPDAYWCWTGVLGWGRVALQGCPREGRLGRLEGGRQCVTMFTEELPWLSEQDQELIMGQAVCAWWGWDRPA